MASSSRAKLATCSRSCPSPANDTENTSKFMRPLAAYSEKRPVSSTRAPTESATPEAW